MILAYSFYQIVLFFIAQFHMYCNLAIIDLAQITNLLASYSY